MLKYAHFSSMAADNAVGIGTIVHTISVGRVVIVLISDSINGVRYKIVSNFRVISL